MSQDDKCDFWWPLLDPNEEDLRNQIGHHCRLEWPHDGDHRCACGEKAPR